VCLVLLAVSWFGWQPIVDEFEKSIGDGWTIQDGRTTLYADILPMIRDFWLFGAGFGTFVDVYPSYKTIVSDGVFEHAHNDYLELLTAGGIVSFGLMAWFVAAVVRSGWRLMVRRRDRYARLVGIGALTSIAALLMHSMVDFNLQNTAIGLYFFFLCGLLTAAVNTRYGYHETESLLAAAPRNQLYGLTLFTVLFLGTVGVVQFGIMAAAHGFSQIRQVYVSSHLDPALMQRVIDGVEQSRRSDPLEAYYPFYRGNLAVLRESRETAGDWYRRAALLRPMEGIYLQRIGLMLPPERQKEASGLLAEGYRRALLKARVVPSWAEWLLITGQRSEAMALIKEWFVRDPGTASGLIPLLETHRFSRQEVAEVLPPSAEAWIRFGTYQEDMGQIEEAGYYRSEALRFVEREEVAKPQWFSQLIGYYQRHTKPDEALAVLRRAVEACPEHAPFRIQLGDYYQREQIWYRALEEYQKAVALEPGNESYRRRLRKLELDIEFGR
jgi:tetratricopeptide (TPR) repeat protein